MWSRGKKREGEPSRDGAKEEKRANDGRETHAEEAGEEAGEAEEEAREEMLAHPLER